MGEDHEAIEALLAEFGYTDEPEDVELSEQWED